MWRMAMAFFMLPFPHMLLHQRLLSRRAAEPYLRLATSD
jgi:hypothetical protein